MSWIDHLNAILVGSVVLLFALGVYSILSQGAREDVQVHAGTAFRESLVTQLELDFENLGAGTLAGGSPVLSADSNSAIIWRARSTRPAPA